MNNRAGLSRDVAVMQDVLSAAGHRVDVHGITPPGRLSRTLSWLTSRDLTWDLAIHIERAVPEWMEFARRNVLLPNPEWFRQTPAFSGMDAILCKTQWTVEIMSRLHPKAVFTGFTSQDRRLSGITREDLRPLHVVGKSHRKGTGAILEAWKNNPGWPALTVVAWKKELIPEETPANVHVVREFVDDTELQRLQGTCGFHLCPSEVEGFGHTIVEGMSAGALVLTTDAPPMNELVSPDRGLLVPWTISEPMRSGQRFVVDPVRLEERIAEAFAAPPARARAFGSAAREWFEQNDAGFRRRLVEVVEALLQN